MATGNEDIDASVDFGVREGLETSYMVEESGILDPYIEEPDYLLRLARLSVRLAFTVCKESEDMSHVDEEIAVSALGIKLGVDRFGNVEQ